MRIGQTARVTMGLGPGVRGVLTLIGVITDIEPDRVRVRMTAESYGRMEDVLNPGTFEREMWFDNAQVH